VKARYRLLGRLLPYLRPYWPVLLAGGLLALLVSSAEALIAWLVKPAMDDIFLKRDMTMLKLIPFAACLARGSVFRPVYSWRRWASASSPASAGALRRIQSMPSPSSPHCTRRS
jgi:ABC-type multidrug transport system fused ATPase/permease subunit